MSAPSQTVPTISASIAACGYTHPGKQREENEDAFRLSFQDGLFLVADGMGGHAAGDVAAHLAVDEVEAFVRQARTDPQAAWPFPVDNRAPFGANLLRVAIKVANQKLRAAAAATPSRLRMGATLAALAFEDTRLVAANVGDVRAYRLRQGKLSRVTRDHSVLEEMRAGLPEQALSGAGAAHRHLVTRALGTKDEVDPTVYLKTPLSGDRYLLCSDGLWSVVDDARLAELASGDDLEQACQGLLDAANDAGGPDNVTAVLVQLG
jgi:serine/threonine protein phosphatase PrpC